LRPDKPGIPPDNNQTVNEGRNFLGIIRLVESLMLKDPLILSFSPQARLGALAIQSGHIRKRIWLGEGTLETPSPLGERVG
jgi:hypothetical protein